MPQHFEYLIAVDFEATCWEIQPHARYRNAEIIEFPAVLANLKTGKIEAEFHKYIRPTEKPILSSYCTGLTGITQRTVDSGILLEDALKMFHEWLCQELRARNLQLPKMSNNNTNGNCAFATWSECDFGIFLDLECQRKGIKKPDYFNQWIDIRTLFMRFFNKNRANFKFALDYVGLRFQGKEHSGIDDAKNLVALAYKMINRGASLTITDDLTPHKLNNMNFA